MTSTPDNEGRGEAYGIDVYLTRGGPRVSDGSRTRSVSRAATGTAGRIRSTTIGATPPRWWGATASRRSSRPPSPRSAASGFPRTPFAGVRVAATERDERFVPERDSLGRLVYEAVPGGLDVLNSGRLPFYARVDLRASFRPRGLQGRWELYVETINALRRKNVSQIDATLEYDPTSDRPRLVETPADGVPFLPTFGVRFRF